MKTLVASLVALAVAVPAAAQQQQQQATAPAAAKPDAELIRNAVSAAPKAVGEKAAVVAIDERGQFRALREGRNGFTCIPDNPLSPGNDPMCVDANGLEWVKAWVERRPPPEGRIGFGYMLQGGSDASNTDPHASQPAAGQKWLETGPHVMILNAGDRLSGYPTQHGDAHSPYVMWSGTPYAHVMIPVADGPAPTARR